MGDHAFGHRLALVACVVGVGIGAAQAQPAAPEFFKNLKEFNVYIGSTAGGGYDQYGRLLARHIGPHLSPATTVVPRNMPAGSGRGVLNFIFSVAPNDGSAVGTTLRNIPFDPLMGIAETKIDPERLTWIGSLNAETSLCVSWHATPFRTIDDLRRKEILMGSSGPSAADSTHVKLLNKVAGTKMKIVPGYLGSSEVHLAMERGEVEGRCGLGWDSIVSRYKSWLDEKKINLLAQFAIDKHPDLPDVPWIMDLATTEADRQLVMLALGPNKMGRPVFAPPDMAADRVAFLRAAFVATMNDPELRADAKKMAVDVDYMTGEATEELYRQLYATPKSVVDDARAIMEGK
ncbi:MAG: Bug family tripartite tricarboxylate transporter substrate binding protein [Gemmatimonas sp.]